MHDFLRNCSRHATMYKINCLKMTKKDILYDSDCSTMGIFCMVCQMQILKTIRENLHVIPLDECFRI